MKSFWKVLRTVIFIPVAFFGIYAIFWFASVFWEEVIALLTTGSKFINPILFYILVLVGLLTIITYLWRYIKLAANYVVWQTLKISPMKTFECVFISAVSLIEAFIVLGDYWDHHSKGGTLEMIGKFIYLYLIVTLFINIVWAVYRSKKILDEWQHEQMLDELSKLKSQMAVIESQKELDRLKLQIEDLKQDWDSHLEQIRNSKDENGIE